MMVCPSLCSRPPRSWSCQVWQMCTSLHCRQSGRAEMLFAGYDEMGELHPLCSPAARDSWHPSWDVERICTTTSTCVPRVCVWPGARDDGTWRCWVPHLCRGEASRVGLLCGPAPLTFPEPRLPSSPWSRQRVSCLPISSCSPVSVKVERADEKVNADMFPLWCPRQSTKSGKEDEGTGWVDVCQSARRWSKYLKSFKMSKQALTLPARPRPRGLGGNHSLPKLDDSLPRLNDRLGADEPRPPRQREEVWCCCWPQKGAGARDEPRPLGRDGGGRGGGASHPPAAPGRSASPALSEKPRPLPFPSESQAQTCLLRWTPQNEGQRRAGDRGKRAGCEVSAASPSPASGDTSTTGLLCGFKRFKGNLGFFIHKHFYSRSLSPPRLPPSLSLSCLPLSRSLSLLFSSPRRPLSFFPLPSSFSLCLIKWEGSVGVVVLKLSL